MQLVDLFSSFIVVDQVNIDMEKLKNIPKSTASVNILIILIPLHFFHCERIVCFFVKLFPLG